MTTDTTPTPVTVERLRELQAKYRGGVERIDPIGARVVQWTELIVILDELLAARETIAELQAQRRDWLDNNVTARVLVAQEKEIEQLRSPAVKQATASGDTEGLREAMKAGAEAVEYVRRETIRMNRDGGCKPIKIEGSKWDMRAQEHVVALRNAALTPLTTQPITEQGKDAWLPIETRPRDEYATYLVTNGKNVAPWINGVIHNNTGTAWDWSYGDTITHWQPMPAVPAPGEPKP